MSLTDWRQHYEDRHREIDEAVALVSDGDSVVFSVREPFGLALALAARKEELRGVRLYTLAPSFDFGWYDEGWGENFEITVGYPTAVVQDAVDAGRVDIYPNGLVPTLAPIPYATGETPPDFYFVEVSPPDERGYCSFGVALWEKRRIARHAKTVIAEVNERTIRTFGENYIHVSEIDYFVDHISTGRSHGKVGTVAGRAVREPEPYLGQIAANVAELIEDGSTLQIGVGRTTEQLVRLGMLDDKKDLGYHSEVTVPGIVTLVQQGIVNGERKTTYPGKVVVTSVGGGSSEEMKWVHMNPQFELLDPERIMDIRVLAQERSLVAINNILSVDLSGQVAIESIGPRLVGAAGGGGQLIFVIGTWHSPHGQSIQVLPSAASNGDISRIVALHPEGTAVGVPRNVVDKIVTEYGVAELKGKSFGERARALIAVAHPDHREDLKKAAGLIHSTFISGAS